MSNQPRKLTVVVAAYDEEPIIARNLQRIVEELAGREGWDWELICVNDGSGDRTGELMDQFATGKCRVRVLHHRRNFGQGRALRTAFDACKGDVIVTLDADLSYGPEYIFRLTEALDEKNVEIALASAYAKGGLVRNVPFYRRFLSRVGNRYLARMSHYRISTSTCVVRAYRREVIDAIYLTSDGMELQLEILMKAGMMRFRVCEIPADLLWSKDKASDAKFGRVSKMRILSTIRLYLLMGWLSRPALVFMVAAMLVVLPGMYMAMALLVRCIARIARNMHLGFLGAVSAGLSETFNAYTYSFFISGALLLFGLQLSAFTMLMLQNKFYFEELYRSHQAINNPTATPVSKPAPSEDQRRAEPDER